MELTVVAKLVAGDKQVDTEAFLQRHVAKKLEKLEQRLGKSPVVRVTLEEGTADFDACVTIHGAPDIVGKERAELMLKAVDGAIDKVTRQFEAALEKKTGRERGRRASGTVKAGEF